MVICLSVCLPITPVKPIQSKFCTHVEYPKLGIKFEDEENLSENKEVVWSYLAKLVITTWLGLNKPGSVKLWVFQSLTDVDTFTYKFANVFAIL